MVNPQRQPHLLFEPIATTGFCAMVELFEEDGVRGARRYLDHLKWNMPSGWTVQNR